MRLGLRTCASGWRGFGSIRRATRCAGLWAVGCVLCCVLCRGGAQVLGERERLEVDTDLGTIQEHLGGLQPGYNHKVESMRLNIDDPCKLSNGNAQPLALYGVLGGLGALSSSLMMWTLGFTRSTQRRVTYWVHRPAEGAPSEGEPPVMFIHGIGIGLLPYRPWLVHLCGQGRTVLVLEVGTVNYSLQDPRSPACQEWVSTLAEVLLALGEVKMDLMAHSYGSVLATWLINSRPEVIRHTLLVDPITVLLQRSDVCRRFLYRPPNKSVKDRIMSTILNKNAMLVTLLMRNFWWFENVLWVDEIQSLNRHVCVMLAQKDEYVDTRSVAEALEAVSNCKVVQIAGTHGDYLFEDQFRVLVLSEMDALLNSDV
eukprot:TRINITY_DN3769_c0_g1_i2.p1 TRINITY_DN3769_c0_g1~~TRINITY_DN3769_c0_g1_i2.p1  ORF type:complete len:370 (-),score=82.38 TRINITY_DN3769_c0_g1_i2:142-1251(-)